MSKTTSWFLLVGLCGLIQVTSVYAFNPDLDPSLIGCWKLDETSGTTAVDSSGHGNNGTIHGNPAWATGKLKGGLNFDGTGDYVDCGNAPIFTFQDAITVSAWVNIRTVAVAWQAIVAKGENAWRLSANNLTQTFHFGITYYTNANYSANGVIQVGLNEWHHLTGTFDGKDIKLYVDGVLDTTTTGASPMGTSTTNLLIGENPEATGRYWNGLLDDIRVYRRALSPQEIAVIMSGVWDPIAENPSPADKQTDVLRDVVLGWKPGPYAQTHDVYFGTAFDDVNDASRTAPGNGLVSKGQDANSYDPPGRLSFGTTYYWRVDEVNAPPSTAIIKGPIWSFTTEPVGYPITNITATASGATSTAPAINTINGSGLTGDLHGTDAKTMWLAPTSASQPAWIRYDFDRVYKLYELWVWNHNTTFEGMLGFGAKDTTVEYSVDGTTWTKLGDFEFAQAPGTEDYAHNTTVPLSGIAAKSVRITINSAWASAKQAGLSEVRFFYIPVLAREPKPATGSTGIDPTTLVLGWRSGREAVSHNIYVGTDANVVKASTTPAGTSSTASYAPAGIQLSTTYYWRVDEVNTAATPSTWAGDVWNFTTPDFLVVDDMESYNDSNNQIFNVWVDGYGTTTNGSMVGYNTSANGTFGETTIIHGGRQSMPLAYNNTGTFTGSEATRTFAGAQDWTAAGIKTLVLFFQGKPGNVAGQLYVKINSTKVTYPGDASLMTKSIWKQWNIDLTKISGLKTVTSLTVGVTGSGTGTLYFDDIRLYKDAPAVPVPTDPGPANLVSYVDMEGGKVADSVSSVTGTLNSVTFTGSLAGLGQAAQFNGTTAYVDLGADYWTKVVSKLSGCTFAVWVNYTGQGAVWQRVFDFGCGSNVNVFLTNAAGTAGIARFAVKTNVANAGSTGTGYVETNVSAPKALTVGWHHIAGVVDATGGTAGNPVLYLYVDGTLAGGPSAGRLPKDMVIQTGTPWQMWLGRSQYTADPYFNGSIDDLRVYNRALSAGEIGYLAGDR